MTENILHFTPKAELDAETNLAGFIDVCRHQLTVFGTDLPFDEMVWDVTDACARKGQGTKRERITFCTLNSAGMFNPTPMLASFSDFAKAYIRYMHGMRPVVSLGSRIAALRALSVALAEHGESTSPTAVNSETLNRAAQLIKAKFSKAMAYRNGRQLELISTFMNEHKLTTAPIRWRNPIPRPTGGTRVGAEFDQKRTEKMPTHAALDALPKIFRSASEPADILTSSIAAILCASPDRINEVLLLPLDCEVTQPQPDSKEDAYGLRWWPAKGADPMVKWVVPSMAGVVKEALERIRHLTAHSRAVATWYEVNPHRLYLPEKLSALRTQEFLSMHQVADILWGHHETKGVSLAWCKTHGVKLVRQGKTLWARFSELEEAVVKQIPKGFPYLNREQGLKYSTALFVVPLNFFHSRKATYIPLIEPVVISHINDALGARIEHGQASIFSKFGFTENDGSPIQVTTHRFRHYLNTLAQAGGLSQLDIAKWSGRKDIHQNEAYDHVSASEMVMTIRQAVGNDELAYGPLASLPKYLPIARDEFARLKIQTAHTTDLGYCIHDYSMMPCQIHRDCINCEEHVCVKGDEAKLAHLRLQLDEARQLLQKARDAAKDEYVGGDRWMQHHQLTVSRLEQLHDIMQNPDIPIGAVIQLSNVRSPSRLGQSTENITENLPAISVDKDEDTPPMALLRDLFAD
ncbi:integrase [Chromobacterium amazonense]|uniref:Integrase n=1 Tax=Chromobacterium amazonense TaxID=1382803 RepID=A0ABU8V4X5_9NEIS|nr:integrase [Chromobacterium amazonense]MDQ4539023.1 integrase [Chromobacterium amazonense]